MITLYSCVMLDASFSYRHHLLLVHRPFAGDVFLLFLAFLLFLSSQCSHLVGMQDAIHNQMPHHFFQCLLYVFWHLVFISFQFGEILCHISLYFLSPNA